MKLYITRHGRTDWNDKGIIQGKADLPLNEYGIKQAHETKELLKDVNFDVIISSPLLRARQTADIINEYHQIDIRVDERIEERNFGEFEGISLTEMDFQDFWNLDRSIPYESAESATAFFNRIHNLLDELQTSSYENILLVAHGGVSLPIYTYFHSFPNGDNLTDYMLKNCEVACYKMNNENKKI